MVIAIVFLTSIFVFTAYVVWAAGHMQRSEPWRREMRERTARLEKIVGASRVGFDCEGFEEPSAYESLVARWLAIAALADRVGFRCTREGDRKRLEFRADGQRLSVTVDDATDWIDLSALLKLANRALKVIDAPGRFAHVYLTDDQCADVAYATPEQREALRRARLLFPIPRRGRNAFR